MSAYGLSLSVANLTGDPFINFCLMGCSDVLSKIFLLHFSKKSPHCASSPKLAHNARSSILFHCAPSFKSSYYAPQWSIFLIKMRAMLLLLVVGGGQAVLSPGLRDYLSSAYNGKQLHSGF